MGNAVEPPSRPERKSNDGPTAADVTERLRVQIQDGLWTPGEWLREARLCTEFAVGRTIVRRALSNLADDGLVILEANRGASVKITTLQEVFDLFELRAGLYGVAARFACIRASAPLMAEILRKTDILLAAHESGAAADELIRQSEVIFSMMMSTASVDAQKMIVAVRRKTRWHLSYMGLADSSRGDGVFDHWRTMRAGFIARDPVRAAEGARNILYFMQNEVSRMMLARGLGMQEPVDMPGAKRRTTARRTG